MYLYADISLSLSLRGRYTRRHVFVSGCLCLTREHICLFSFCGMNAHSCGMNAYLPAGRYTIIRCSSFEILEAFAAAEF